MAAGAEAQPTATMRLPFADIAAAHRQRMAADGAPEVAIHAFLRALRYVADGSDGCIREASLADIGLLPEADALAADATRWSALGLEALDRVAVLKLNGGLGTTMGMRGPKSLVEIRDGRCFLDLVAEQVLALRGRSRRQIPLIFMDSFRTQAQTLTHLQRHFDLDVGLPLDFLQHRVPKVLAESLLPVPLDTSGVDPDLCWCPPGHGDLYPALVSSGLLAKLQGHGVEWLFCSNVDNLGATLDLAIYGYITQLGAPLVMEVAHRTAADRKGGHLGRAGQGGLLLRESAQCSPEDRDAFADLDRHRYFNTNSLWLHLPSLAKALAAHGGSLDLPVIVNRKRLDPNDAASPAVLQLESAMGAAIAVLPGAAALAVPRSRFAPVKSAADLLALRSDRFEIASDATLRVCGDGPVPTIDLDERFYRTVDDLALRFPHGVPSMRELLRLRLRGDVRFAAGVTLCGEVDLAAPEGEIRRISAGAVICDRDT